MTQNPEEIEDFQNLAPGTETILEHFKFMWKTKKRFIVCSGGAGSGKAMPLDTPILTPNGPELLGKLNVGDIICSATGGKSKIMHTWFHPQEQVYVVTLSDGRDIKCCSGHLWRCIVDGTEHTVDTLTLMQLVRNDFVFLPLPEPLYFHDDMSESEFERQMEEIETCLKKDQVCYVHNAMYTLSKSRRYAVIDRLCKNYDGDSMSFAQKVISPWLAYVVRSMGGMAYEKPNGVMVYDPFPAEGKVEIVSVVCTKEIVDMMCISVSAPDHLYVAGHFIVTHNSYTICQRISHIFMTQPEALIAVVRESMPSLKRTIYLGDPSIVKTLARWGVPVYDWLNKSENKMTNPYNGAEIYFIGLDDPEKIKSLNLNYVWVDECTSINQDKFAQLDTRCRSYKPGITNQIFLSYNPISYNNWVVQMFAINPSDFIKENTHINFSNFTQNPYVKMKDVSSWLDRAKNNESYYRTYITGEPGAPLGLVYPAFKPLPYDMWPEEVKSLPAWYGVDWGYMDPMVMVEVRSYEEVIYARCIYYRRKMFTQNLIGFMDRNALSKSAIIYCDSAERDRIESLRKGGYLNAWRARKNRKAGISHLQGSKVVYDNSGLNGKRFTSEVESYSYEPNPDDMNRFLDDPDDGDDHILDALRYATYSHHLDEVEFCTDTLVLSDFEREIRDLTTKETEEQPVTSTRIDVFEDEDYNGEDTDDNPFIV